VLSLRRLDGTRRAKGEVPPAPPRPKGVERNVVVTLWDVGDDHSFMHDEIRPTRRPTVNAGGNVYAVSAGHGQLVVSTERKQDVRPRQFPRASPRKNTLALPRPQRPSLHWGNEHLWANPPYNPADPHNPMIDSKGRVWMTSKIRSNQESVVGATAPPTSRGLVPDAKQRGPGGLLRPEDEDVHADRHLLSTHHLQFDTTPTKLCTSNELGRTHLLAGSTPKVVTSRPKDSRRQTAGAVRC